LGPTYDGNHAVWLEQGVEVLQEFEGEQRDGLGASSKDVVDDVVEALFGLVGGQALCVGHCVLDHGGVVARELEVLGGELVDNRVKLHHGSVDAVGYQGCGGGANAEAAWTCQHVFSGCCPGGGSYITRALASLSRIGSGVSTSLTASSMANTP
jgi:hypothetical protein